MSSGCNAALKMSVQLAGIHKPVSVHTMIYTHVLKIAAGGTASPLDSLLSA